MKKNRAVIQWEIKSQSAVNFIGRQNGFYIETDAFVFPERVYIHGFELLMGDRQNNCIIFFAAQL